MSLTVEEAMPFSCSRDGLTRQIPRCTDPSSNKRVPYQTPKEKLDAPSKSNRVHNRAKNLCFSTINTTKGRGDIVHKQESHSHRSNIGTEEERKNDIIRKCQIRKLCDKKMQSQYHQKPKRKPETTII
jgi:hypothetical protein